MLPELPAQFTLLDTIIIALYCEEYSYEASNLSTLPCRFVPLHSFIHSSVSLQPFVGPWRLLQFRNLFYTDGRTPWTGDQPVARPLPTHKTTQTQSSMPLNGIRTHDLSIRASEDSSCLGPRGQRNRHCPTLVEIFSNTLSLCSSLNVRDQVSHPHKTAGEINCSLYLRFWTAGEKAQAFPEFILLLFSSWIQFRFVSIIHKGWLLNSRLFLIDPRSLHLLVICLKSSDVSEEYVAYIFRFEE
jgi:hypothetical protein